MRIADLRTRDVVSVNDGRRLGLIKDVELDLEEGRIRSLILPGMPRAWGLLGRTDDMVVPWERVKKLGVDVILVDTDENSMVMAR